MQFHLHEMNHTFSDLVFLLKKNYRIIEQQKIKDTPRSDNTEINFIIDDGSICFVLIKINIYS